MPLAVVTGGSRGLGRATTAALVGRGWTVVIDGRDAQSLAAVAEEFSGAVTTLAGDVSDAEHRVELARVVRRSGSLDLLVNNASELGPSPLPELARYPLPELERVLGVNVVAPLALIQQLVPHLSEGATVINVTSDAAVEAYPGWGGYGLSKAALDQLTAVLAAERPDIRWYAFDPGDMRTAMHQAAYPGEDISDRPEPDTAVPALLRLIDAHPPSGRYRKVDLLTAAGAGA